MFLKYKSNKITDRKSLKPMYILLMNYKYQVTTLINRFHKTNKPIK